jgi:hypothetical protein
MNQKQLEKIKLSTGLVLDVWNCSRSIAPDTDKVELYITTTIYLDPSFFAEPAQYEITRKHFGENILFEYRNGRTFVPKIDSETVFQEFIDTFHHNVLPYLNTPDFPRRFVISKYRDILQNPFKYKQNNE